MGIQPQVHRYIGQRKPELPAVLKGLMAQQKGQPSKSSSAVLNLPQSIHRLLFSFGEIQIALEDIQLNLASFFRYLQPGDLCERICAYHHHLIHHQDRKIDFLRLLFLHLIGQHGARHFIAGRQKPVISVRLRIVIRDILSEGNFRLPSLCGHAGGNGHGCREQQGQNAFFHKYCAVSSHPSVPPICPAMFSRSSADFSR